MTFIPDKRVVRAVLDDPSPVLDRFRQLNDWLDQLHSPVIKELESFLQSLEGYSFGSLENNQEVAAQIQMLLNCLSRRIHCPRKNCHESAMLECRATGGAKNGLFQFRHMVNGTHTNHTGRAYLPELRLCFAPPTVNRQRGEAKSKRDSDDGSISIPNGDTQTRLTAESLADMDGVSGKGAKERQKLQSILHQLEGTPITESFVHALQSILKDRQWGITCTNCQTPARPMWKLRPACTEGGCLQFSHTGKTGKTEVHSGHTKLPKITVVKRLDRRHRKSV